MTIISLRESVLIAPADRAIQVFIVLAFQYNRIDRLRVYILYCRLESSLVMSSAKPGSMGRSLREFRFVVGDLVLVKWHDGMVYFAKIKKLDAKKRKCTVVFDDKSQDEAHFSQIHSGK